MQAIRKIDTKQLVSTLDDGGQGSLTPGPGEELVTLPDTTAREMEEKIRRSAGTPRVGRTILHDDGSVVAEPEVPRSATPMTDGILASRKAKGARPDAPVTLEELAEAERSTRGG